MPTRVGLPVADVAKTQRLLSYRGNKQRNLEWRFGEAELRGCAIPGRTLATRKA
jgi:hypothetical protein